MEKIEGDNRVRITNIGGGDLLAVIDEKIQAIAEDIAERDDNTGKRVLTVKIEFIPEDSHVGIKYYAENKLPKDNAGSSLAFIDEELRLVSKIAKQQRLPNMELVKSKRVND